MNPVHAGYLRSQELAFRAAETVARDLAPGWTERRAAELLETFLRDHGVKSFFHRPFVWFGERTRFDGIPGGPRGYAAFAPTDRVLLESEAYILDVAPILDGFTCDIGYSDVMAPNPEFTRARACLDRLRADLPERALEAADAQELCDWVDGRIRDDGFEPIHHRYPFGVLGHRVHRVEPRASKLPVPSVLNFGWESYWQLLSRGLFGELLRPGRKGKLEGMWAVEPHLGGAGFGAKFEEILVVEDGECFWLGEKHVDRKSGVDHGRRRGNR